MKKKLLIITFLVFFCIPISIYAAPRTNERTLEDLKLPEGVTVDGEKALDIVKLPSVDETQKIYDFTDSLTEEEEEEISKDLEQYTKETGIDSVILFTNDLKGFSLSYYAYNFYDYNNFTREGIIFVIYLNEDKTQLFMGNSGSRDSKVFTVYSDDRINEILKYLYHKHTGDSNYFQICKDYIVLTEEYYFKEYGKYVVDSEGRLITDIPWLEIIVIALSSTFIIVLFLTVRFGTRGKRKNTVVKDSVNQTNMVVKLEYDKLLEKQE